MGQVNVNPPGSGGPVVTNDGGFGAGMIIGIILLILIVLVLVDFVQLRAFVFGFVDINHVVEIEIFGPVATMQTFRTPQEAVELANNTRYGLAASVWTENLNLSLDIAARVKAGVVWINSTNLFDAASGFGGYRESGFGREGGREGLYEYLIPAWEKKMKPVANEPAARLSALPSVDATDVLTVHLEANGAVVWMA